jgi:L-alanine-DL-glutamate epimerase-like enolase superfamily enzyme
MRLKIRRIEAWACVLPLGQTLAIGPFQVRQRSHLVVRVLTDEGLQADCVTQTRGSPLDVVVADVIAPRLIGRDALDIEACRALVRRDLVAMEFDGAVGRAWSALEICLHDLRAQAAGWPMWRLLGGRRAYAAEAMVVEGYAIEGESDTQFVDRLLQRVEQGFRRIKIEAGHYGNSEALPLRLAEFRRQAGNECRLVLDFAWSWDRAQPHLDLARKVASYRLDWLEDPLERTLLHDYRLLRQQSGVAIGCGDESSRAADLTALAAASAIDVMRVDATTIGGIEPLRQLSIAAIERGLRVSYHEHPEVHQHCVFGFGAADHVEMFPTNRPFDRVHDLIVDSPFDRVRNGVLQPPEQAGSGICLRMDAVEQTARRRHRIEASS